MMGGIYNDSHSKAKKRIDFFSVLFIFFAHGYQKDKRPV